MYVLRNTAHLKPKVSVPVYSEFFLLWKGCHQGILKFIVSNEGDNVPEMMPLFVKWIRERL